MAKGKDLGSRAAILAILFFASVKSLDVSVVKFFAHAGCEAADVVKPKARLCESWITKAITYLNDPNRWRDEDENAEGVYHLQPRVARGGALPWVIIAKRIATPKGLPTAFARTWLNSRTLSEFITSLVTFRSQGVALGWNFRTPSAFTNDDEHGIRQMY